MLSTKQEQLIKPTKITFTDLNLNYSQKIPSRKVKTYARKKKLVVEKNHSSTSELLIEQFSKNNLAQYCNKYYDEGENDNLSKNTQINPQNHKSNLALGENKQLIKAKEKHEKPKINITKLQSPITNSNIIFPYPNTKNVSSISKSLKSRADKVESQDPSKNNSFKPLNTMNSSPYLRPKENTTMKRSSPRSNSVYLPLTTSLQNREIKSINSQYKTNRDSLQWEKSSSNWSFRPKISSRINGDIMHNLSTTSMDTHNMSFRRKLEGIRILSENNVSENNVSENNKSENISDSNHREPITKEIPILIKDNCVREFTKFTTKELFDSRIEGYKAKEEWRRHINLPFVMEDRNEKQGTKMTVRIETDEPHSFDILEPNNVRSCKKVGIPKVVDSDNEMLEEYYTSVNSQNIQNLNIENPNLNIENLKNPNPKNLNPKNLNIPNPNINNTKVSRYINLAKDIMRGKRKVGRAKNELRPSKEEEILTYTKFPIIRPSPSISDDTSFGEVPHHLSLNAVTPANKNYPRWFIPPKLWNENYTQKIIRGNVMLNSMFDGSPIINREIGGYRVLEVRDHIRRNIYIREKEGLPYGLAKFMSRDLQCKLIHNARQPKKVILK